MILHHHHPLDSTHAVLIHEHEDKGYHHHPETQHMLGCPSDHYPHDELLGDNHALHHFACGHDRP